MILNFKYENLKYWITKFNIQMLYVLFFYFTFVKSIKIGYYTLIKYKCL